MPTGSTDSFALVPNVLMLQPALDTHRLTGINNGLYASNYQLTTPEIISTMGEPFNFSKAGNMDSAKSAPSRGNLLPDPYYSTATTDVYVCTKDDCAQQFTSFSEIQKHGDERHQNSATFIAYHSFYVLHSTMSRYGFYKSPMRFWCRLCSTEKGFETNLMLRDHAQKQHPWVCLPEQIESVPDVAGACPPSTAVVGSESLLDIPPASRCSSRDTVVGELTDPDHPDGRQAIHRIKKLGKTGQLDWEGHRGMLSELYITQDHSLDQVMEHMSSTYNFHAKMRAYKERFKLWGFDKNVPAHDMAAIVALVEKRKREDGKESLVFFKGRLIKTMKMERYKRRKMVQEKIGEPAALPSHIRCETPPLGSPISDSPKMNDCSSHIPISESLCHNVKSLADATFNDYWVLNEVPKVKVPEESGSQTFSNRTRTLLSQASAHETRDDHEGAERLYREVLELPDTKKDSTAVFDALRGVVRIRAKAEELGTVIPELERLVAGCLCFFGPKHETYLSLALELAGKYYILGRQLEGNVLIGRLLAAYETSSGKIQEDPCAFLLTRASRWNPEVVGTPRFNTVYWRLIEQYEHSENWEDSVSLTLDIIELLQDTSSQDRVLAKTTESYLRRAYGLYTRQEKHVRYAHCHKLLNCTLVQVNESGASWMDKVLILLDVLQNDLTAHYFLAVPIAHHRQPITKLIRCYEALSQPLKIAALISEVRTRSTLARHWSPFDWEVFIEELRTYARELQEISPNGLTIEVLLTLAREYETVENMMV
ncbi:hypothetical protein MMC18_002786 [Xylographa bjoerkii]|nr:hypothetical protein [Xylographa bjoerkii]